MNCEYRNTSETQISRSTMHQTLSSVHPATWLKLASYALLLVGLYFSALSKLITRDWARDDYTYAYVIPFLVLYLIWDRRSNLMDIPSISSWKGMTPFIAGLGLFWLGELGGNTFILYISLWFVLVGLLWLHLGWEKLKTISFALIMILSMFPLPSYLYNKLSVRLQLISTQLSALMIRFSGLPAFREGNIIDLGFTQLQVVEACSGLRYLLPLIVMGLLLAYFFKAALWKRAILIISTVPLAIVANSIRIALTGILHKIWGARVADAFFHGFSGWFIFMLCMGILLFEMWILGRMGNSKSENSAHEKVSLDLFSHPRGLRLPPRGTRNISDKPYLQREESQKVEKELKATSNSARSRTGIELPRVLQPQFLVAVVLLIAILTLSQGINYRERIPIKKSLAKFPLHLSEWTGTRQSMEQRFIYSLGLSDYALIDFANQEGKSVYLYVAYYESQSRGHHTHSPATCLRGGGWILREMGATTISTPGYYNGAMKFNSAIIDKQGSRQFCYYWFPQRGRILNNVYQLKIFTFWDALTKQRTDGALVRVITPVYESEELRDAEARLQAFTRVIVPVLDEYIPGKDLG